MVIGWSFPTSTPAISTVRCCPSRRGWNIPLPGWHHRLASLRQHTAPGRTVARSSTSRWPSAIVLPWGCLPRCTRRSPQIARCSSCAHRCTRPGPAASAAGCSATAARLPPQRSFPSACAVMSCTIGDVIVRVYCPATTWVSPSGPLTLRARFCGNSASQYETLQCPQPWVAPFARTRRLVVRWLISRKLRPSSSSGEYPMMSQYRWLMRWMIPVWESTWATHGGLVEQGAKTLLALAAGVVRGFGLDQGDGALAHQHGGQQPGAAQKRCPGRARHPGSRCSEGDSRDCVGRKVSRHRRLCTSSSLVKGRAPASASAVGASNERLVPSCA